jgi:lisH domain-containing protein FOPNL
MAELRDLKDALRDALERRGSLGALRAQIRHEVFAAMEDGADAAHPTPPENVILNEMIREYLEFNHYGHSLAVFAPEAGLPPKPLPRSYVAQQAHLHETNELPLLYSLLAPSAAAREQATPAPEQEVPPQEEPLAQAPPSSAMPFATAAAAAPPRRARVPGPTPVIFTAGP